MMRAAFDIARKEVRVYVTTWTSWVLLAAFLELTGFFFVLLVREFQARRLQYVESHAVGLVARMNLTDLVVTPTLSYVATFFLFLLPILTMRLVAEERREGTLELLLTAPVRPFAIVIGKYLAAWSVMAAMLATSLTLPAALVWLVAGDPAAVDWSTVAVGYLGMLLLGSAGVAIGLFASSATDSQLVAVVVSFSILLVLVMLGIAAHGQAAPWGALLEHLSISHHQQAFGRGLIRSQDVVYYLSVTVLGLALAHRLIDAERWR